MKSFQEKLEDLSQKALEFIKKSVKKKIVFATVEQLEEDNDLLVELPSISYVTKHGFYEEYAILSIEKIDDRFIAHTTGKGENYGQNEDFEIDEIDSPSLCYLADAIKEI